MLKNKDTGDVYFVVVFSLVANEVGSGDGDGAPNAMDGGDQSRDDRGGGVDGGGGGGFEPSADDLD